MSKIIIKDNYAYMVAPNPNENNEPWVYYQPIHEHLWMECDARMLDIDKIKKELTK